VTWKVKASELGKQGKCLGKNSAFARQAKASALTRQARQEPWQARQVQWKGMLIALSSQVTWKGKASALAR
jgi:hypothetical protein